MCAQCLGLLTSLLSPRRQGVDAQAAALLEGVQLHFMPSMNPDGFAARTRGNRCLDAAHSSCSGLHLHWSHICCVPKQANRKLLLA